VESPAVLQLIPQDGCFVNKTYFDLYLHTQVEEQANFWGCEEFLPKFPQTFLKITPTKRLHFFSILGAFFSNQSTSSTIFAQFTPNCPNFP